tara:strand:+ start:318 stop:944 length:627 start_codon:yes stop_codon:yes gene_type:complete
VAEIIGLSGYAGCGKDLFFNLFKEEIRKMNGSSTTRVALADPLKKEVQSTLLQLKGIDPLSCSRQQKDMIRDILVFYGVHRRNQTEGRYWIDQATEKIQELSEKFDFILVTDIRFNRFIRDEVPWVREELKGKLLVIKQFVYEPDMHCVNTAYQKPPNDTEEINMLNVEKYADYTLEWPFSDEKGHIENNLRPAVREFISKYYEDANK